MLFLVRLDFRLDEAEAEAWGFCIADEGVGLGTPRSVTIHSDDGFQWAKAYSVGLDMVAVSLPFFLRVEGSGDGRVFVASGRGSCTFCRFERRADEVEDWSPCTICCA